RPGEGYDRRQEGIGGSNPPGLEEATREKGRHAEAGEMQLDDWKKINKDVLDKLGYDEKRLEGLRRAYEAMGTRRRAGAQEKDAPVAPQNGGSLGNTGVRRVQPAGAGRSDALRGGDSALPPPGYRDAYREFTRPKSPSSEAGDKK